MQIISFPAHYQSVYTNFDISSFSLISCIPKAAVLQRKTYAFTVQNSRFRNAKSKLSFSVRIIFTKLRRFPLSVLSYKEENRSSNKVLLILYFLNSEMLLQ